MTHDKMVQLAVNTIRTLSIGAVQAAKSGHPGTPMALDPLVYTIWNRAMNFDPQDPICPNRARFVLSNGHASMPLWSVLHLTQTQAVDADYERLRLHGLIKKIGKTYKYYLTGLAQRAVLVGLKLKEHLIVPALAAPWA